MYKKGCLKNMQKKDVQKDVQKRMFKNKVNQ